MRILVFLLIFGSLKTYAQNVEINVITTAKNKVFSLVKVQDFISKSELLLAETKSDSTGRFQFNIPIDRYEKVIIRSGNVFSVLYLQPDAKYYVQFNESGLTNFVKDNEAELTFINLDTNDVNYKILSFENWMDKALAVLYPLKNRNSGEFLKELQKFKVAADQIFNREENQYLRAYYKYTIGLNIEEINGFNSNSRPEKYDFYIKETSISLENEKFFSYLESFYKSFFYEFSSDRRLEINYQLEIGNFKRFITLLSEDSLIQNTTLSEVVGIYILKELLLSKKIAKETFLNYLKYLYQNSTHKDIRFIANNTWHEYNVLEEGMPIYFSQSKLLKKERFKDKYIYIHFFNPSNYLCISELGALNALHRKYKDYIEFITFYPQKNGYTEQELTYLAKLNWVSYDIQRTDPIWKELNIQSFPTYILVNSDLIIESMYAKSPTPNGKYETIEKTFFDIKQEIEGN